MFKNLLNALPSVKEAICYGFQYYLGIELNIDNLSLDQNNNINLHLTNINIEPNKINGNFLQDLNIKLTKGNIEKLEIKFGINQFEIKISKISIFLMPAIILNKNNIEEGKIKEENNDINTDSQPDNKLNNQTDNKLDSKLDDKPSSKSDNKSDNNNSNESMGMLNSLINYYLNKLKISIDEINIYAFNYEINNKNIAFANPILSLHIYKILYDDIKNENNINKIENNPKEYFWVDKHFSIATISVKIIKSFDLKKKDEVAQSSYNTTSKDNILLFNEEKGIHFYSNKNKEIKGNFGDIQIIMDLFQLELLKNFIDTYSLYFNISNNETNSKFNNIKNENISEKNNNISANNNLVMNLKIELSSFSLILFENSHIYSETPKFFEYSKILEKNKFFQHFCYFEDNFFVFLITNISFEFNTKKNIINFSIDEINLNYIEFNAKLKNDKNNEKDCLPKMGSYYSECNDSMIFKSEGVFLPAGDENISLYSYEYFQTFTFQFYGNEILSINNIRLVLGFDNINKNLNQIKFINNNININFHPFLIFKMLLFLYENTLLIKEIIFYNNEHKIFDKEINNKENDKNIDNNNVCNLSFSSVNSQENSDKSNININNALSDSDIIKISDIENSKNNNDLDEVDSLKNFINSVNIEVTFKNIEIRIYSFKYESDDYNMINPFISEFYYENICIMDIKEEFKEKKLKYNQITSDNYFCLSIKNIKLYNKKNKNNEYEFKINSIILAFANSKILQLANDSFICEFLYDQKKLLLDLNLDIYFELKNLTSIISFANIWKNTFLIYEIFFGQMEYNYNKGQKELKKMNFDKKILKLYLQNLHKTNDNNNINNNISTGNNEFKFAVEIKINKINVCLDVLPKKIQIKTFINNIKLTYFYTQTTQKELESNLVAQDIEFSLQKIESKELGFCINNIQIKLNITESSYINKNNINDNTPKKTKKYFEVIPEENMDIYINRMIKYNKLNHKDNNINTNNKSIIKENNKLTTKINIIIQSINIFLIENLLYINDIYNIIIKDELYNNSLRQDYNENSINNVSLSSSSSSNKAMKSNISNKTDNDQNDSLENKNNEPPFIINFLINNIEIDIKDKTEKTIILKINNINFTQNILKIERINFDIFYEIKEQKEKIKVNVGFINDIYLNIMEKNNFCSSYIIKIKEINFSFCRDTFYYLQNVADNISNLL